MFKRLQLINKMTNLDILENVFLMIMDPTDVQNFACCSSQVAKRVSRFKLFKFEQFNLLSRYRPIQTTKTKLFFRNKYLTPEELRKEYGKVGDEYYTRGYIYRMTCPLDIKIVKNRKRKSLDLSN